MYKKNNKVKLTADEARALRLEQLRLEQLKAKERMTLENKQARTYTGNYIEIADVLNNDLIDGAELYNQAERIVKVVSKLLVTKLKGISDGVELATISKSKIDRVFNLYYAARSNKSNYMDYEDCIQSAILGFLEARACGATTSDELNKGAYRLTNKVIYNSGHDLPTDNIGILQNDTMYTVPERLTGTEKLRFKKLIELITANLTDKQIEVIQYMYYHNTTNQSEVSRALNVGQSAINKRMQLIRKLAIKLFVFSELEYISLQSSLNNTIDDFLNNNTV